ncbi:hypothetical protein GCM10010174_45740 [Kutzneria viridogrisea]
MLSALARTGTTASSWRSALRPGTTPARAGKPNWKSQYLSTNQHPGVPADLPGDTGLGLGPQRIAQALSGGCVGIGPYSQSSAWFWYQSRTCPAR